MHLLSPSLSSREHYLFEELALEKEVLATDLSTSPKRRAFRSLLTNSDAPDGGVGWCTALERMSHVPAILMPPTDPHVEIAREAACGDPCEVFSVDTRRGWTYASEMEGLSHEPQVLIPESYIAYHFAAVFLPSAEG